MPSAAKLPIGSIEKLQAYSVAPGVALPDLGLAVLNLISLLSFVPFPVAVQTFMFLGVVQASCFHVAVQSIIRRPN